MSDLIVESRSIPALTNVKVDRLSALPPEILFLIFENLEADSTSKPYPFQLLNRRLLPFEQRRVYRAVKFSDPPGKSDPWQWSDSVSLAQFERTITARGSGQVSLSHLVKRLSIVFNGDISRGVGGTDGRSLREIMVSLLPHLNQLRHINFRHNAALSDLIFSCSSPSFLQLTSLELAIDSSTFPPPLQFISLFPNLQDLSLFNSIRNSPTVDLTHASTRAPPDRCYQLRSLKIESHYGLPCEFLLPLIQMIEVQSLTVYSANISAFAANVNDSVVALDLSDLEDGREFGLYNFQRFTSLRRIDFTGYDGTISLELLSSFLASLPIETLFFGFSFQVNVPELITALRSRPSTSPLSRIILNNIHEGDAEVEDSDFDSDDDEDERPPREFFPEWMVNCRKEHVEELVAVAKDMKIELVGTTIAGLERVLDDEAWFAERFWSG